MKFYDNKLDRRVAFARHAQSIDETRADFDRVKWIYDGGERQRALVRLTIGSKAHCIVSIIVSVARCFLRMLRA
jgi:Uncharacterized alpha/beta hydrolase domain (DUF2235)